MNSLDSSSIDFCDTVPEALEASQASAQIDANRKRKRTHLNEKRRIEMLKFFEMHSTKETAERFGCTERYVTNWNRRFAATGNCKRKLRKDSSWKESELQILEKSLIAYNSLSQQSCSSQKFRTRNVLLPTYNEIAVAKEKSYSSLQRLAASRLLGTVDHKKVGKCQDSKEEHQNAQEEHQNTQEEHHRHNHHNHQAKYPGEIVAIDRKDVPIGVYSDSLHDEECAKKIRGELIHQIIRQTNMILCRLYEAEKAAPELEKLFSVLRREAIDDYKTNLEEIRAKPTEEILRKKYYQYTAVDECTRWPFRMLMTEHSEMASFVFMIRLLEIAPFSIERVKTDNGSEFTNKYLKNHEDHDTMFEILLKQEGIKYTRIQPGKPWQNGKVESQHRLDDEWFYSNVIFKDYEDACEKLKEYNERSACYSRMCLKGKNPLEMLACF